MKVRQFREPTEIVRAYEEMDEIHLPVRVTRIKLPHKDVKGSHYCYIVEFGYDEAWIFDESTDYSGTGGRYFKEMEEFIGRLKEEFADSPHFEYTEYEIPFEVYWKLYNLLYGLFKGGED